jgi:hypothetical protein
MQFLGAYSKRDNLRAEEDALLDSGADSCRTEDRGALDRLDGAVVGGGIVSTSVRYRFFREASELEAIIDRSRLRLVMSESHSKTSD